MSAQLVEATKRCRGCDRELSVEAFPVKSRRGDGSVHRRHSRCSGCRREFVREAGLAYRQRKRSGVPVEEEVVPALPIEPWRDWLRARGGGVGELAECLHTSERRVYEWLNNAEIVRLDTVDAALCAAGESLALRDLSYRCAEMEALLEEFGPLWDGHGRDLFAPALRAAGAWAVLYARLPA